MLPNTKKNKLSGGANTNVNGKKFEIKTMNDYIINNGILTNISYSNIGKKLTPTKKKVAPNELYYILSINNADYNCDLLYFCQSAFKTYMKIHYGIELFRHPDEAYIIINKRVPIFTEEITIKILEKKNQNSEGSCETKLWASPSLKEEYSIMFSNAGLIIKIEYGLCINQFFQDKMKNSLKYKILAQILAKHNIQVLYGDAQNYIEQLNNWILL